MTERMAHLPKSQTCTGDHSGGLFDRGSVAASRVCETQTEVFCNREWDFNARGKSKPEA